MRTCVALFRGINIGGRHILPMQNLRDILAGQGCEQVRTYIQSGNAVLRTSRDTESLAADISAAIDCDFGFAPRVLVLPAERFEAIVAGNPYPEAEQTPKFLYVWFLAELPANPDLDALTAIKADSETFALGDGAFYLHAPDGVGRSRLANMVEKRLGVATTARNWNTVKKLEGLLGSSVE